jgi:hypothetical protein
MKHRVTSLAGVKATELRLKPKKGPYRPDRLRAAEHKARTAASRDRKRYQAAQKVLDALLREQRANHPQPYG